MFTGPSSRTCGVGCPRSIRSRSVHQAAEPGELGVGALAGAERSEEVTVERERVPRQMLRSCGRGSDLAGSQ